MKITGFKCISSSNEIISCDSFGNNAAISCPICNQPILFVALKNQKGSSVTHPTQCIGCTRSFYIEANEINQVITIREKV